jgi:outer membrane protein OmpA-like peptidoglycan-associated protein
MNCMRNRLLGLVLMLTGMAAQAQEIQWAARIQGFSSQAGQQANAAQQVLGPPNKFPASGDSPVAWAPHYEDATGAPYIKVGFSRPTPVQQVLIAESHQTGCVQAVYLFDRNQKEYLVYEAPKNEPGEPGGRMLRVQFKQTRYPVYSVKVVLKDRNAWGRDQIDAIGIADHTEPWKPVIASTEKFRVEGTATPLSSAVNTAYSEILPRLDAANNRLYFCRKNHPDNQGFKPNDDIWYSERDADGEWSAPRNMGWPLNDENHNYVCSVSEDGKMLTLGNGYRIDRKPQAGVSQSLLSDQQWIEPLNLRIDGLSILNLNAEYYLSRNRKVLVLAMESWDSQGGKDLYVSFSDDYLHFSKPVSMGKVINSAGTEMAPFISDDGLFLFFSSDGFPGYGSHDVFVAERLDETWTSWSVPENMGPVVNSPAWDSYFSYHSASGQAFLASNRDAFSNEDLYVIKLTEETPDHLMAQNQEPAAMAAVHEESSLLLEQTLLQVESGKASYSGIAQDAKPVPSMMLYGAVTDASSGELIHATISLFPAADAGGSKSFEPQEAEPENRLHTGRNHYKVGVHANQTYLAQVSAPGYFADAVRFQVRDNGKGSMRQDFALIPIKEGQTISLDHIYFDVNSSVLQEKSHESLDRWAELLLQNPGVSIQVQGHTNNRCSPKYCLELSQKRAMAVSEYLQSQGILEHRLRFRGFGSEVPVANNEKEDGRARNQRVELKILEVR